MNPSTSENEKNNWQPCDEGTIKAVGDAARRRQDAVSRRAFIRNVTTSSIAIAGAGFVGWSLMQPRNELRALHNNPNYPGGIACSEVQRYLADYISESLTDVALTESISVHLSKCRHCNEIHDQMVQNA